MRSRWQSVIGPKLTAKKLDNQMTEAKVGVCVLNRMTDLGLPKFGCKHTVKAAGLAA
jgi:hypothetical protein